MASIESKEPIIIIGGGWAGLSSAIHLTQQGYPIHLFEASRQLGGRARSGKMGELNIDNGQHISLGACQETLNLFNILGIPEQDIFHRQALHLTLFSPLQNTPIKIATNHWPAPFHLVYGLVTACGFNSLEKFSLIKLFIALALKNFSLKTDISLLQLITQYQQSNKLIKYFWEPLCLSIMNTPIESASAVIFLRVLKDSFNQKRQFSDLLLFKNSLYQSLAEPAYDFLQQNGNSIALQEKVTDLVVKNNQIQGVETTKGSYQSHQVILATPKQTTAQLLGSISTCNEIISNIQQIKDEPIYTLYLSYQSPFQLSDYMLGMVDSFSQWVFDHRLTGQTGMLAVVISGPGKHQQLNNSELINAIDGELRDVFDHLPPLAKGKVLIEKKATFSCVAGIDAIRPNSKTPISGLYLAGDYTQTGYPSTLEGAVVSGVNAQKYLLDS